MLQRPLYCGILINGYIVSLFDHMCNIMSVLSVLMVRLHVMYGINLYRNDSKNVLDNCN